MRRLRAAIQELVRGLVDALWPPTCVACGELLRAGHRLACPRCHAHIARAMRRPCCARCGRTLSSTAIHVENCARCRNEPFWNVAGVARVGLYRDDPPLREIIVRLKYSRGERNADYLAARLAESVRQTTWGAELEALVPVPMHWLRRLQRPCNHALLLAEALARELKLPVVRAVKRVRDRPSQASMTTRAARFENVADCFAPTRRARAVRGRRVCIVDNVMTAGATVYEVSKVLRRAGAKRIYAAVVARPASPGDPVSASLPGEAGLPEWHASPAASDKAGAETPRDTSPATRAPS